MKEKFVVQELRPYEGWEDLLEFDDFNSALNFVQEHYNSFNYRVEYRIIIVMFDTQKDTIYEVTNI